MDEVRADRHVSLRLLRSSGGLQSAILKGCCRGRHSIHFQRRSLYVLFRSRELQFLSVARTVVRNLASSWVGFASQLVVTFFLTPFVIGALGTEAYGVWLLLQATVGYYGLVDMGLRAGLTQSITRRIAAGDIDAVRGHLGAAVPMLACLGLLVTVIGGALGWVLPRAVEMAPAVQSGLWIVILVQAVSVGLQMPFAPYGAVLVGLQRYDIANGLAVVTRLLSAGLTYLALVNGGGLLALSVVLLISNVIDSVIRSRLAIYLLPGIRGVVPKLNRSELSELSNVGVWNFLIHISRRLICFSDALVIGVLFSAAAVVPFGIASALVEYGDRIIVMSVRILFPTMVQLKADGNREHLRDLYIGATRIIFATSIAIVIVGATWITPFLLLWLGGGAETEAIRAQAPALFLALGIAFAFVGLQRAGIQLILADGQLKRLAFFLFAEAALNLVLSLVCGRWLGVIGVAIGTAIPAAIMGFGYHLPLHCKVLGIRYSRLLAELAVRPVIFGMLLLGAMQLMTQVTAAPATWPAFASRGIAVVVISMPLGLLLLSTAQRSVVLGKLVSLPRIAFSR
ncbi:lipopolysaccharide biosynthesis protein [Rubripirellula lacrimiformis]|uniref:lipopolysaccharide biosynthesis protein n=1 Tax=Rubripirellula lacrimiformis TaxID=1930273 RepID=UPI001C54C5F9|nr:polysaccharide biosynthesis C-terminal domain-containing protein [Rubripirellula lacrimiformis]